MSEERDLKVDDVLRDVSTKLGALGADIASIKTDVAEIKTQTTRTNGRVSSLERWQAYIKGGLGLALTLIGWIIVIKFGH